MKNFDGYLKRKFGDSYVLLAGGGHKALSDFILGADNHNHDDRYLKLTGGTLTNSNNVLNILSTSPESWIYFLSTISNTSAARASVGYYSGLAFIANEKGYQRIGVLDNGTPVYRSGSTATDYVLLHEGNYTNYVYNKSTSDDKYLPRGNVDISDIVGTVGWGQMAGSSWTPLLQLRGSRISGDYGCLYIATKPNTAANDGGTGVSVQTDGYFYQNGGNYRITDVSETVTALSTNENYLTWTKNGIVNNITIPYATNSDKLDGHHLSDLYWANIQVQTSSDTGKQPTFGVIHLWPNGGNYYDEGIRIHPASNGWSTIALCASDNTGTTGVTSNSWNIHRDPSNDFYINRGSSNGHTGYELCNVSGNWGVGTTSPSQKLHVSGNTYTSQTFISGACQSSTNITTIPSQSAIALQFGAGNSTGANTWIWRLNWASANYGLFFNDDNDTLYWVGGSTSRMSLDTNTGWVTVTNLKLGNLNLKSSVNSSTPIATWINNNSNQGFDYITGSQLTVGWANKLTNTVSLWGNNFDGSNSINSTIRLAFGQQVIIGTQNNNTSSTSSYLSAGSGYSVNSGRYGVKVLSCDQTDCQSGIGQDCSGKPYDMCVISCSGTGSYSYISFVNHPVNSTSYTTMGYFTYSTSGHSLTVNGNTYASNYYTTSDARKKQNIHKISDNIKQFNWKETGELSYGFVAQDLEVNHPELVNDDGNMKTVNYNAALSLVIAKLENRVRLLESKLGLETPPPVFN